MINFNQWKVNTTVHEFYPPLELERVPTMFELALETELTPFITIEELLSTGSL